MAIEVGIEVKALVGLPIIFFLLKVGHGSECAICLHTFANKGPSFASQKIGGYG